MSWWISCFLCGFLPDWMRFKRLLKFPSRHSSLNKGKAGNSFLTYLRSRRKNSHFSGISHAQTPAMATRINLLPLDQVSRSSEYPLLRNCEKYSNFQTPSRLANNQFWHGWSTVHWASIRWAQTYASVPIVGQSKTNPRLVPKYLPGVMFEFLNRRTILKVPHWNLKHSSHRFGCPTACYKSGFSSNFVSTEAVWSLARAKIPSSDDTRHHGCFFVVVGKSIVKWRPKKYSFVYVLIRLTSLVCMRKIQKKCCLRARLVSLIST